jgi:hypothetical protein
VAVPDPDGLPNLPFDPRKAVAATLRVNLQTGEVSFGKGFFPGECIDGVIRGSIPGTFLTAQFIRSLQTVTMVAPK